MQVVDFVLVIRGIPSRDGARYDTKKHTMAAASVIADVTLDELHERLYHDRRFDKTLDSGDMITVIPVRADS